MQDAVSFTEDLGVSDIPKYIMDCFDQNMAMFSLTELFDLKSVKLVDQSNKIIYTIPCAKKDINKTAQDLERVRIPIYSHNYGVRANKNGSSINIELYDMRTQGL